MYRFFFFLIFVSSLQAESKVLFGRILSLKEKKEENLEQTIRKNLISNSNVEYIPVETPAKGLDLAKSKGFKLYCEVYYQKSENLPPEIYIATFDVEKRYLIDLVSEKPTSSLPPDFTIVPEKFTESEQEIFAKAYKKFEISLSLNPSLEILHENITENSQNKKVRIEILDYIKNVSQDERAEAAFSYLNQEFDTATRTSQKIEDLPITVGSVSKEEIRSYNYRTLVEALKFKTGIMVSEPGNGEMGHHFFQRGLLGNSYTKILLNGMPLTPSVVNGMPINEMLYLKHAESIEIVYGPASAVYGADAFAGVVNIKTIPKSSKQIHLETHVGNMGYLNTNFFVVQNAKLGEKDLVVNSYGIKSQRQDQNIKKGYSDVYFAEKYYQRSGQFGDRFNFFSEIPSKNQAFGIGISYGSFHFFVDSMRRSDHSSQGYQPSLYNYSTSDPKIEDTLTRYALKNSFELGNFTFNTNLSYNQYRWIILLITT